MSIPDGIEFLMPWRIIEDSHEIQKHNGEKLRSKCEELTVWLSQ